MLLFMFKEQNKRYVSTLSLFLPLSPGQSDKLYGFIRSSRNEHQQKRHALYYLENNMYFINLHFSW